MKSLLFILILTLNSISYSWGVIFCNYSDTQMMTKAVIQNHGLSCSSLRNPPTSYGYELKPKAKHIVFGEGALPAIYGVCSISVHNDQGFSKQQSNSDTWANYAVIINGTEKNGYYAEFIFTLDPNFEDDYCTDLN